MFHIMVAEDDTNTRKLMCTVLKQNGYEPVLLLFTVGAYCHKIFILKEEAELPSACIQHLLHGACGDFFQLIVAKIGFRKAAYAYAIVG